jgi:competence protein ComEA
MKKLYISLVACILPALGLAGPVNINTADAQQLASELDGVGLAKAEAIIRYREQNGAFATPEELVKVKGIGDRILDANAGNILVSD